MIAPRDACMAKQAGRSHVFGDAKVDAKDAPSGAPRGIFPQGRHLPPKQGAWRPPGALGNLANLGAGGAGIGAPMGLQWGHKYKPPARRAAATRGRWRPTADDWLITVAI